MTVVLFAGDPAEAENWAEPLTRWARELGVPIELHTDRAAVAPERVEALVTAPQGPDEDFSPYAGARLIHSVWAGVESFLANPTFPDGPVFCRMVEQDMTTTMTDYVCGHVLRHHLGIDRHVANSAKGVWEKTAAPPSSARKVGVLGLGALGGDAARMLAALRFDVAGWSRSPKHVTGVECFHGEDGLEALLARSEIVVTLLPSTEDTRHILNARTLAMPPRGAVVINPGRGPLIDDDALLAALASGQIAHATLDVFDTEPLPPDHPYWRHDQVTVTPHIAAETQTDGAARVVIEQIGRLQRGEPLRYVVNREGGY